MSRPAIWEQLALENPSVTGFMSTLAGSHANIGVVQRDLGRPAESLESHEKALAIQQRLRENPSVTEFQGDVASSQTNVGLAKMERVGPRRHWRRLSRAAQSANGWWREPVGYRVPIQASPKLPRYRLSAE